MATHNNILMSALEISLTALKEGSTLAHTSAPSHVSCIGGNPFFIFLERALGECMPQLVASPALAGSRVIARNDTVSNAWI